jgi:hypothetical protein
MLWRTVAALVVALWGCDDAAEAAPPGGGVGDAAVAPDTGRGGRGADAVAPPDAAAADAGRDAAAADAAAADAARADAAPPGAGACARTYRPPEVVASLPGDALDEVSGLAASRAAPGALWMHNDSGDRARLFAVGPDGALLGRVSLPGVTARDAEDLALARCPDGVGDCLWLADVGDNAGAREDAVVYALPEPPIRLAPFADREAARVWRFPVAYPGGPVDVEALAVAPDGGTFYLIEKRDAPTVQVFAHPGPLVDGERALLRTVARFAAPGIDVDRGRLVTAADLHPTGLRLLVRVYTGSYEYRLAPGQTLADLDGLMPTLVALGPLAEPQGEAIAYTADGRAVVTVSEDPAGVGGQPVHRYDCRD